MKLRKPVDTQFPSALEMKYVVDLSSGCWLWIGTIHPTGYGVYTKDYVQYYAHRESYRKHKGLIPEGLLICHTCDTPRCINPEHLFVGTHKDNSADMVAKGRHYSRTKGSKLSIEEVLLIREDTRLHREIAKDYKVSRVLVTDIKNRKKWYWL